MSTQPNTINISRSSKMLRFEELLRNEYFGGLTEVETDEYEELANELSITELFVCQVNVAKYSD